MWTTSSGLSKTLAGNALDSNSEKGTSNSGCKCIHHPFQRFLMDNMNRWTMTTCGLKFWMPTRFLLGKARFTSEHIILKVSLIDISAPAFSADCRWDCDLPDLITQWQKILELHWFVCIPHLYFTLCLFTWVQEFLVLPFSHWCCELPGIM